MKSSASELGLRSKILTVTRQSCEIITDNSPFRPSLNIKFSLFDCSQVSFWDLCMYTRIVRYMAHQLVQAKKRFEIRPPDICMFRDMDLQILGCLNRARSWVCCRIYSSQSQENSPHDSSYCRYSDVDRFERHACHKTLLKS